MWLEGSWELRGRGPCQIHPPLASGLLKMPVMSSSGMWLSEYQRVQNVTGAKFPFLQLLSPPFSSSLASSVLKAQPAPLPNSIWPLPTEVGRPLIYWACRGILAWCLLPTEGLWAAGPVCARVTWQIEMLTHRREGPPACGHPVCSLVCRMFIALMFAEYQMCFRGKAGAGLGGYSLQGG